MREGSGREEEDKGIIQVGEEERISKGRRRKTNVM